jgi:WD40 repeat protein
VGLRRPLAVPVARVPKGESTKQPGRSTTTTSVRRLFSAVLLPAVVLFHLAATLAPSQPPKPPVRVTAHTGKVVALAFSPNGKILATAGEDRWVRLWDPATGKEKATLKKHGEGVLALAFSPDGKTLATGDGGLLRVWDLPTGREAPALRLEDDLVRLLAFSPDGKTIAEAGFQWKIRLWDLAEGKVRATLPAKDKEALTGQITALAFRPGSPILASSGWDECIRLWNPVTQKQEAVLQGHREVVRCLAFSPDGKTILSGGDDRDVRVWDVATGKGKGSLARTPCWIFCLAFSPNGKLAAVADRDSVRLLDFPSGRTRDVRRNPAQCLAFNPDGKTLALGLEDGSVLFWDVPASE